MIYRVVTRLCTGCEQWFCIKIQWKFKNKDWLTQAGYRRRRLTLFKDFKADGWIARLGALEATGAILPDGKDGKGKRMKI